VPYDADSLTYRLRQVDTDGSTSHSEPITIARSPMNRVRLLGTSPSPARGQATVRYALPENLGSRLERGVTLHLYDMLGRRVRTRQSSATAGRHEILLETDGLSSGAYLLRVHADGTVRTKRLTIVE
jgi:hypothetical protein